MLILAGDCTQVATETIAIVRRLPHPSCNRYRVVFVFSTPEDNVPRRSLCDQHLPAFIDMFDQMLERVVNGPGFLDMRSVDANMYLVLSLRAFNRGPPMIPHNSPCSEESFHISVGEHLGLLSWIRFKPHEILLARVLAVLHGAAGVPVEDLWGHGWSQACPLPMCRCAVGVEPVESVFPRSLQGAESSLPPRQWGTEEPELD